MLSSKAAKAADGLSIRHHGLGAVPANVLTHDLEKLHAYLWSSNATHRNAAKQGDFSEKQAHSALALLLNKKSLLCTETVCQRNPSQKDRNFVISLLKEEANFNEKSLEELPK